MTATPLTETSVNPALLAVLLAPQNGEKVTEAEFQDRVVRLATACGWKVLLVRPVRIQRRNGSVYYETPFGAGGKGYPDVTLVRNGCVIWAELKVGKNETTPEQDAWLQALQDTGAAAGVWRWPESWPDIVRTLDKGVA